MNSSEEKIREAFEEEFIKTLDLTMDKDAWGRAKYQHPYINCLFDGFKAGYLAMLNSLEYVGENKVDKLYALPEGVTRED